MQHALEHHVLNKAGTPKKFFLQIQTRHGLTHVAQTAVGLFACVLHHERCGLIIKVQVPVVHDVCG